MKPTRATPDIVRRTKKQTSDAVSSIAAKYVRMKDVTMQNLAVAWPRSKAERFFDDIRKLAASCLAQDEVKGGK